MTPARLLRGVLIAGAIALTKPPPSSAASLSGAYLAAAQADFRNDYATATEYYERALTHDPDNSGLLHSAALTHVALGDFAAALDLAERLAAIAPGDQTALLVMLTDAIARGDFPSAARIAASAGPEMNPLLGGLVAGWIEAGRDDFAAAQARFDAMTENEALAAYGQYHKALALALAGDFVSAETILAGGPQGPLHLSRAALTAHAQILAQIDREAEAIALLDEAIAASYPDATLLDLRARLTSSEEVGFEQVTRAEDGAAEAFLTLAEALNSEESDRLALIYARLAAQIRPMAIEPQLLAAEVLERHGQYALATDALADVPADSPLFVTSEIRRANTQRSAGDPDAGIATLAALGGSHPDLIEVHSALGDALRVAERFAESAAAYTRAVALIPEPQALHWVIFYTRGIAYERAGDFDAAEADFRKALELEPDQPLVLNYLGYSLVEKRRNLDEALEMIEKAVAGQPDDGYITDSLGWVLYRLGRYEGALPHMLRAAELLPVDPIINDHLGDVLWMVGRQREAVFQWRRALSFGPEQETDAARIRRKLEVGLDVVLEDEKIAGSDG